MGLRGRPNPSPSIRELNDDGSVGPGPTGPFIGFRTHDLLPTWSQRPPGPIKGVVLDSQQTRLVQNQIFHLQQQITSNIRQIISHVDKIEENLERVDENMDQIQHLKVQTVSFTQGIKRLGDDIKTAQSDIQTSNDGIHDLAATVDSGYPTRSSPMTDFSGGLSYVRTSCLDTSSLTS